MRLACRIAITSIALSLSLAACGGDKKSANPDAAGTPDGDVTVPDAPACPTARQLVYSGTTKPMYVPLTQGQILAIGAWTQGGAGDEYCSGTLIAPRWVLTANHCEVAVGDTFCFGANSATGTCIAAKTVYAQPWSALGTKPGLLDLTLVELTDDATTKIPGVEPIPLWTSDEGPLLGKTIEIAGFGETETQSYNDLLFAVETVDAVGPDDDGQQWLRVNAQGARGPCFGDSGGPAMVVDDQCHVRVAGALSWGDDPYGAAECPGQDRYTRVDLARSWIDSLVGPTDGACDGIDAAGTCVGTTATYCASGALMQDDCSASHCGWDATASGYRCVAAADACGGTGASGSCVGNVAHACADGVTSTTDCAAASKLCYFDADAGKADCQTDTCMGYDYAGTCTGTTLHYCDLGQVQVVDCAANGMTCGYVASEMGNDCK